MRYQYQTDTEQGTGTFRELVLLTSEGRILPNDKVRALGDEEWMYAADVPGLFHMADRDDVLQTWYAEQSAAESERGRGPNDESSAEEEGFALGEIDALLDSKESADVEETPAWLLRLRLVEAQRAESSDAESTLYTASRLQEATDAAVAIADSKQEKRRRLARIGENLRAIGSVNSQKWFLRIVFSFAAANLTAYGILNWSDVETQKAPNHEEIVAGVKAFPLLGKCSSGEFMFLTADAVIIAAAIGFFGARGLESVTDYG